MGSIMLLLALAAPGDLPAADTLRYREETTGAMVVETPQGEVTVRSDHRGVVAFVPVRADSAVAWYEELAIAATSPHEERRPETADVLHREFVLRFDERGRVETARAPELPDSFRGVSDIRYQFADFFPTRPLEPLHVGLAWVDTLTVAQLEADQSGGTTERIARFEVVGDTTMHGEAAFVVRSEATLRTEASGPLDGAPGVQVVVRLEGPEQNRFVVRKSDARMLLRARSAELTGTMEYTGMPQPVVMAIERTYENTIELVAPRP